MIAAIVLAAGRSQRFGYANKLLAHSRSMPLIAQTLRALRGAPLQPIVVVTGHCHHRVAATVRREIGVTGRLRIVRNRCFRSGMAGSLRAGIAVLPRYCNGVLICLGDMPALDRRIIRRLLLAQRSRWDYVRPVSSGRPGHPVLISRRLFKPIVAGRGGDSGAQAVLSGVPRTRRGLIPAGRACVDDIDTPQALRHAAMRGPQRT